MSRLKNQGRGTTHPADGRNEKNRIRRVRQTNNERFGRGLRKRSHKNDGGQHHFQRCYWGNSTSWLLQLGILGRGFLIRGLGMDEIFLYHTRV